MSSPAISFLLPQQMPAPVIRQENIFRIALLAQFHEIIPFRILRSEICGPFFEIVFRQKLAPVQANGDMIGTKKLPELFEVTILARGVAFVVDVPKCVHAQRIFLVAGTSPAFAFVAGV